MPTIIADQKCYYMVFWWKDIALGEIFVEPGDVLSERSYHQRLIVAIRPAIQFYAKVENITGALWEDWLINGQFDEWYRWMNTLFSPWIALQIPDIVPVSVIICTKNRSTYLKQCLQLLKGLRCIPEEILVVDNAPEDISTKEVVDQFNGVTYVKEPRAGLDIARNTGLKNARCPIIAFTDDDVLVHPLWIYHIWHSFEDPVIAAMTGLVIASKLDTEAQLIFEKRWSFNRGYVDKIFDQVFFKSTLSTGPPVWEIGAGANMAFRKSIFDQVGYFNNLLDVGAAGCSGDSEIWFRILLAGHSILYNPRAIVYHEHRKDIQGLKKQIFSYMRGHTVAALLQYDQCPESGYRNRIFKQFPAHYKGVIRSKFPHFHFEFLTTWVEINGILSGLVFYYKNKRRLLQTIR